MGPKKSNIKKSGSKKNEKSKEQLEITQNLKKLLKEYEVQCEEQKSLVDPNLKCSLQNSITESQHLVRVS